MKHHCPSETGRGKPCRNGSHFVHDGGSRTPPEFLDAENLPWISWTVRDPYSLMNGNYKAEAGYGGIKARLRNWSPNLRKNIYQKRSVSQNDEFEYS
jgi:hypothetical protein